MESAQEQQQSKLRELKQTQNLNNFSCNCRKLRKRLQNFSVYHFHFIQFLLFFSDFFLAVFPRLADIVLLKNCAYFRFRFQAVACVASNVCASVRECVSMSLCVNAGEKCPNPPRPSGLVWLGLAWSGLVMLPLSAHKLK